MTKLNGVIIEEDTITIYENGVELMRWIEDEWIEDTQVTLLIASRIKDYYENQ